MAIRRETMSIEAPMNKLEIASKYFSYKRQDRVAWVFNRQGALNRTVVEIQARSGSTRIKDKNIREVCGLPLMAYSILFARQLKGVDRIIVNTDDERYASIAREFGAEVPFLRPPELSNFSAKGSMATFFLERFLMDQDYPLKKIITFLPTSPFRNKHTIEGIIDKLDFIPLACAGFFPDTSLSRTLVEREGFISRPKVPEGKTRGKVFFKKTGMIAGLNIIPSKGMSRYIHVIRSPIELIDIDKEEDLEDMEVIIRNKAYDFGCSL